MGSYLAYLVAEVVGMSGIVALFFSGESAFSHPLVMPWLSANQRSTVRAGRCGGLVSSAGGFNVHASAQVRLLVAPSMPPEYLRPPLKCLLPTVVDPACAGICHAHYSHYNVSVEAQVPHCAAHCTAASPELHSHWVPGLQLFTN